MRTLTSTAALLLVAACASAPAPLASHSTSDADRAAVLEVAQAFFDVIASREAEAAAQLVVPGGAIVDVRRTDGVPQLRSRSNTSFLEGMDGEPRDYLEVWDGEPTVLIDGDLAVVWGRYVFEVDGQRSHVGTDAFCLVRTEDGWRVAGGAYSVER